MMDAKEKEPTPYLERQARVTTDGADHRRRTSTGGLGPQRGTGAATHSVNMYSQWSRTKSQARRCPCRLLATAVMTTVASCLRMSVEFKVKDRYLQEKQGELTRGVPQGLALGPPSTS